MGFDPWPLKKKCIKMLISPLPSSSSFRESETNRQLCCLSLGALNRTVSMFKSWIFLASFADMFSSTYFFKGVSFCLCLFFRTVSFSSAMLSTCLSTALFFCFKNFEVDKALGNHKAPFPSSVLRSRFDFV